MSLDIEKHLNVPLLITPEENWDHPIIDSILNTRQTLREKCGLVGMIGPSTSLNTVLEILARLGHRGGPGNGLFSIGKSFSKNSLYLELKGISKLQGIIENVKDETSRVISGHTRYATVKSGREKEECLQPIISEEIKTSVAHNGNISNTEKIDDFLKERNNPRKTSLDSECFLRLMEIYWKEAKGNIVNALVKALSHVQGAYSLVLTHQDKDDDVKLIAVRDPWGTRPLVWGGDINGNFLVASESQAMWHRGIKDRDIKEIMPGEIRVFEKGGLQQRTYFPFERVVPQKCIFELIYFSSPLSETFGISCANFRTATGKEIIREIILAGKRDVFNVDIVTPIPLSGIYGTQGAYQEIINTYDNKRGLDVTDIQQLPPHLTIGNPIVQERLTNLKDKIIKTNKPEYRDTIVRSSPARLFMSESKTPENIRKNTIKKQEINQPVVFNKIILLGDDSMVRGNTAIIIGERYIMFGAAGVYIIIFSPPVTSKCNKGLDTEDHELIARQILEKQGIVVGPNADDNYWKGKQKLIEEYLKQKHNIKGLSYLSLGGLKKVISSFNADPLHFCLKCFNGQEELQAPPQISSDWIDIA